MATKRQSGGTVGYVYGVRLRDQDEYRYVGITQSTVARRLRRHMSNARQGRKTPFYDWLRREGEDRVTADILEVVTTSRDALGCAKSRKGTYAGADNPNYGKFGADHPGYGRVMTDEQRRALSEARRGALNPNFGKTASAETRAKRSAAVKGRPMPSSRRSAHTRYHSNKGVVSADCAYCQEALQATKPTDEKD